MDQYLFNYEMKNLDFYASINSNQLFEFGEKGDKKGNVNVSEFMKKKNSLFLQYHTMDNSKPLFLKINIQQGNKVIFSYEVPNEKWTQEKLKLLFVKETLKFAIE
jgi:hypothetical protein